MGRGGRCHGRSQGLGPGGGAGGGGRGEGGGGARARRPALPTRAPRRGRLRGEDAASDGEREDRLRGDSILIHLDFAPISAYRDISPVARVLALFVWFGFYCVKFPKIPSLPIEMDNVTRLHE